MNDLVVTLHNIVVGNANTTVNFGIYYDNESLDIDWETMEVWYNGIDIVQTLSDQASEPIEKQILLRWQEVLNQVYAYQDSLVDYDD